MTAGRRIDIDVPALARVEGEGGLRVRLRDDRVEELELRIFEPPRFFEKFLEGRSYQEVPDAVARICGICPVAYQMSAVHAIETAFGISPGDWVRALRRALYCGEWIESHSLHITLLAAPDFLKCNSVIELAKAHPEVARRGLQLQRLGNDIIKLLGGRSVHPVGVRVGGFSRPPQPADVQALVERLRAGLPDAEALLRWTAQLPLPADEQDFVSIALRHGAEYPMNEGHIVSSLGMQLAPEKFAVRFTERHMPQSTALHCLLDGKPYLVGPLARLNLNHDLVPDAVRELLAECGITLPSRNMFHSIVARAAEIYLALTEAVRILQAYRVPEASCVAVPVRAGVGCAATEAPRGLLWHRYELDERGAVKAARIVPPTSQNQARIEEDLRVSIERYASRLDEDQLRLYCETIIRNYDPCISCATHFLRLTLERA